MTATCDRCGKRFEKELDDWFQLCHSCWTDHCSNGVVGRLTKVREVKSDVVV